jgi:hypothetical protein
VQDDVRALERAVEGARLRLLQGRHRNAAGTGGLLAARHLDAFRRLDVRPQAHPMRRHALCMRAMLRIMRVSSTSAAGVAMSVSGTATIVSQDTRRAP